MTHRPYLLLAELTYQCPLHCPYCSNPTSMQAGQELSTADWQRVLAQAGEMGVFHVGFSGGEPLLRADLAELVASARAAGLYTNLITSGVGLNERRAAQLREAGLDSVQISFQAATAAQADAIAGTRANQAKIEASAAVRAAGLPLSLNVVIHRANIESVPEIIALAKRVGAARLELANVQYYGWAFRNRLHLLPTRAPAEAARHAAEAGQQRLAGVMEILYVLPDYYERRPKPCMQGWGRRFLTVNPIGQVLPCPTASGIPGLRFDNVRDKPLSWIWSESESFRRFRGTEWMPEPCRSCPQREVDFGGCRCQAALLTGDPCATDPVCELAPARGKIDEIIEFANQSPQLTPWEFRQSPTPAWAPIA